MNATTEEQVRAAEVGVLSARDAAGSCRCAGHRRVLERRLEQLEAAQAAALAAEGT